MMYIYAGLLLHRAGKKITEESLKKVLEAAGVKVDEARVKALVSTLEGVNIDEAVKKAAMPIAAPAASGGEADAKAGEKKEEKKPEEEKKTQEAAAAGLGALFG